MDEAVEGDESVLDPFPETVSNGAQGNVFAGQVEDRLRTGVEGLHSNCSGSCIVGGVDGDAVGGWDAEGCYTRETRGASVEVSYWAQDIDGELVGFSNGNDLLSSRSPDGEVLVGVDSGIPQAGGRADDGSRGDVFLI